MCYINDLIMYRDDGAIFLAIILYKINDTRYPRYCIRDIKIIMNNPDSYTMADSLVISEQDIMKNFGNITFEMWSELYPEWCI